MEVPGNVVRDRRAADPRSVVSNDGRTRRGAVYGVAGCARRGGCVRGGGAAARLLTATIILRGCATAACLCAQRVMECDDVAERSACDAREKACFYFIYHIQNIESRWPRARALTGRTAGQRYRWGR